MFGGSWIVGDHHDRFSVIAIERLQQIEDLIARLAIEVSSRFIAKEQRRIRHDRAGDAHALLLAA